MTRLYVFNPIRLTAYLELTVKDLREGKRTRNDRYFLESLYHKTSGSEGAGTVFIDCVPFRDTILDVFAEDPGTFQVKPSPITKER